jgi:hypothetical protein
MSVNLADIANIGTVISGVGTVVALLISIRALTENTKAEKGKNILEINSLLNDGKYYEISKIIRSELTVTHKWPEVDEYLGVFEICKILIKQGSLDLQIFKNQFGVKLSNIRYHPEIMYYKLIIEFRYWKSLYELMDMILDNPIFMRFYKFLEKMEDSKSIRIIECEDIKKLQMSMGDDNMEQLKEYYKLIQGSEFSL